MAFTVLNLEPVLDPLFTKCASDVQAVRPGLTAATSVARLKSACVHVATAEINRQGAIYTSEETAYVFKMKRMHQESKALSATLIQYTAQMAAAWNKGLFKEMSAKADYVRELATEGHHEAQDAVAHQGWRAQGWNYTLGTAAVGADNQKTLETLYLHYRAPMIAATADLKTYMVKLDEFAARADDCMKTAASLNARAGVNMAKLISECSDLAKKAHDMELFVKGSAIPHRIEGFQPLTVFMNTKKTKPEAKVLGLAEQVQQAAEILDKNKRSELKTLTVLYDNLLLRANNSVPDNAVTGSLQAADTSLRASRRVFDAFGVSIANHKKKITEAKTRH